GRRCAGAPRGDVARGRAHPGLGNRGGHPHERDAAPRRGHCRESDRSSDMTNEPIYLDHNATTPVLPEVVDAMLPYLREHFGNPSSGHVYGARTRSAMGRAREQVAALLGCDAEEVLFTSGGTEANN